MRVKPGRELESKYMSWDFDVMATGKHRFRFVAPQTDSHSRREKKINFNSAQRTYSREPRIMALLQDGSWVYHHRRWHLDSHYTMSYFTSRQLHMYNALGCCEVWGRGIISGSCWLALYGIRALWLQMYTYVPLMARKKKEKKKKRKLYL